MKQKTVLKDLNEVPYASTNYGLLNGKLYFCYKADVRWANFYGHEYDGKRLTSYKGEILGDEV